MAAVVERSGLVVGDTSPLRCLYVLDRLDLLGAIFSSILMPPAVLAELKASGMGDISAKVLAYPSIVVTSPADLAMVARLREELDSGESEAIALALEVNAKTLLIDERRGRQIAKRSGLEVLGVLGLLLEAKERGLVGKVRPLFEELRAVGGFYASDALLERLIRSAGES